MVGGAAKQTHLSWWIGCDPSRYHPKKEGNIYTPVIKHSNGNSPFSIGNTSSKGSFSIAMLDYQRVTIFWVGMELLSLPGGKLLYYSSLFWLVLKGVFF